MTDDEFMVWNRKASQDNGYDAVSQIFYQLQRTRFGKYKAWLFWTFCAIPLWGVLEEQFYENYWTIWYRWQAGCQPWDVRPPKPPPRFAPIEPSQTVDY